MELHEFKETLLGFLSDVTHISEATKDAFLTQKEYKPFNAPEGYLVLTPYVLFKIETTTRKPNIPTPEFESNMSKEEREAELKKIEIERQKDEIFYCHIAFRFFTASHRYFISAVWQDYHPTYLGCIASTRTPRPGEDWTRGNDLPDGYFCRETWEHIKNAIIRYEMKPLSEYVAKGHYYNPEKQVDVTNG